MKRCIVCNLQFSPYHGLQKTCSIVCRQVLLAFNLAKTNAKRRGIAFEFTFKQWWRIWKRSGRWNWRGREIDRYCMARHHDRGAYRVGNVKIITHRENAASLEFSVESRNKISKSLIGNTRAVGSKSKLGQKTPMVVRKKISLALTGRIASPETRAKMRKAHKRRHRKQKP